MCFERAGATANCEVEEVRGGETGPANLAANWGLNGPQTPFIKTLKVLFKSYCYTTDQTL